MPVLEGAGVPLRRSPSGRHVPRRGRAPRVPRVRATRPRPSPVVGTRVSPQDRPRTRRHHDLAATRCSPRPPGGRPRVRRSHHMASMSTSSSLCATSPGRRPRSGRSGSRTDTRSFARFERRLIRQMDRAPSRRAFGETRTLAGSLTGGRATCPPTTSTLRYAAAGRRPVAAVRLRQLLQLDASASTPPGDPAGGQRQPGSRAGPAAPARQRGARRPD